MVRGPRCYAPALGRFLTRDPLGQGAGPNVYAFCNGDPINLGDPLGLMPWQRGVTIIGGGVIGFICLGPLGAVGGAFAGAELYDATANAGQIQGEYEGGKASGLDLVGGYVRLGIAGASVLAPVAARLRLNALLRACGPKGPCCVAGTLVALASGGAVPIERVKAGEVVWSRNPITGKTEGRRVIAVRQRRAHTLITVRFARRQTGKIVDTLTATPEHPFFVPGRGAIPLGQLGIGTQVVTRAGPPLVIASRVGREYPQGVPVYNFEVQGDHTYFVGKANGGVWVHNQCVPRARFEVTPDGTAIPTSKAELEQGFQDAGLNSYPNTHS